MGLRGVWWLLVVVGLSACSNPLARQYEYDEQTYLEVDGSATVVIAASVPALVALRGLALDPSPDARLDADAVREVFAAGGCEVVRSSRPWRRAGRRFVQVSIRVADVRAASECRALAWSAYAFELDESTLVYRQEVGGPTGVVPAVTGWTGAEVVGFKLHLPSKVLEHNVRRLEDNEPGTLERGNILTWEQRLSDRLTGVPIVMEVTTEPESILYQTIFLFAGAFVAAVLMLATIIWIVIRRGRVRLRELRR